MPCYYPLQAYLPSAGALSKKVIFDPTSPDLGQPIMLPCGRCAGCRLEYSRQWAIRIVHESKLYKHNCYITLSYSPEHLPVDGSLRLSDFQHFMKRFRKRVSSKGFIDKYGFYCKKLRFFHCGEYGERYGRPHYHACVFNFDFPDRKYLKTRNGVKLYRSELLNQLWGFGDCVVGNVTFESAAYVARYCVKKINGKTSEGKPEFLHYADIGLENIDFETGEIFTKSKEYTTMSRRPGIGHDFVVDNMKDIYPSDSVVCRGREMRPPKYYDGLYEIDNGINLEIIKQRRVDVASKFSADSTPDRLLSREMVEKAKLSLYSRKLE